MNDSSYAPRRMQLGLALFVAAASGFIALTDDNMVPEWRKIFRSAEDD